MTLHFRFTSSSPENTLNYVYFLFVDLMMSLPINLNSTDSSSLRCLYPDIPSTSPPLSLIASPHFNQMITQSSAAAWLQQHQRERMMNTLLSQSLPSHAHLSLKHQIEPEKTKDNLSFSIDNIISGNYEKSRKISQHDLPSSPESSSGLASDSGLKYECEVCAKTYSTFSGFSKHKQFYCTPQSKKQFNCKHCDKTYFSLGALKMHIRTHTLPCKCKVCGKAFSRPWLLQGHMRTHTGEKPFKCQHCGRAFADRSNLRAHLQTHSDIKKYSCKQCKKTFSRMSLLLKHEESSCMTTNGAMMTSMFN